MSHNRIFILSSCHLVILSSCHLVILSSCHLYNHKGASEIMITRPKVNKVVLAYSGGLDTSIIVPWLKQNYGNPEVVCYCANLGQADELTGLEEKAKASGASKCYVEDLREEFVRDFLFPMLQSGAIYERIYLLGTSVAR